MAAPQKNFPCFVCKTRTVPISRRRISEKNYVLIKSIFKREAKPGTDVICNKCHCRLRVKQPDDETALSGLNDPDLSDGDENKENISEPNSSNGSATVTIPIQRVPKCTSRCFLCRKQAFTHNNIVVSFAAFTLCIKQVYKRR